MTFYIFTSVNMKKYGTYSKRFSVMYEIKMF